METLIIHSESSKIKVIIGILKVFNVSFELKKGNTKSFTNYNSEFVAKIKCSELNIKKDNLQELKLKI